MSSPNRTCHVCGQRYYYCTSASCSESFGKPTWMVMFDCENCKNIWNIISDHFYKKITDEEAIELLKNCDLSQRDNYNFSSDVNKDLDELFKLYNDKYPKKQTNNEHLKYNPKHKK